MRKKQVQGILSFSSCTSHLHFYKMAAQLNMRNGLNFCLHPEPYNLGINYNFNFITIKAMASSRKEKHETPKI